MRASLSKNFFEASDLSFFVVNGLKSNGYVKIHNFGSFKIKRKKSRIGRNPKTKENVMISERNVLTFKPSKSVIIYINKNNEK